MSSLFACDPSRSTPSPHPHTHTRSLTRPPLSAYPFRLPLPAPPCLPSLLPEKLAACQQDLSLVAKELRTLNLPRDDPKLLGEAGQGRGGAGTGERQGRHVHVCAGEGLRSCTEAELQLVGAPLWQMDACMHAAHGVSGVQMAGLIGTNWFGELHGPTGADGLRAALYVPQA